MDYGKPTANFPMNYSGHWYHSGEYEVDVDINATHIYMKTRLDRCVRVCVCGRAPHVCVCV